MTEERILGKFPPPGCRRPSVGSETLFVARTGAPFLGNTPRQYGGEGEVIANAALCRKKE
jgi:hypothetical protein